MIKRFVIVTTVLCFISSPAFANCTPSKSDKSLACPPPVRVSVKYNGFSPFHLISFEPLSLKYLYTRSNWFFDKYRSLKSTDKGEYINVLALGDSWFTYNDPGMGGASFTPLLSNILPWLSILGQPDPTIKAIAPTRAIFHPKIKERFNQELELVKSANKLIDNTELKYRHKLLILALSNNGEIASNMAGISSEESLDIKDSIQNNVGIPEATFRNMDIMKQHKDHFDYALISAGGNDILNPDRLKAMLKFSYCTNEEDALNSCFDNKKFDEYLDRVQKSYDLMITNLSAIDPNIKIITHTYDFLQPYPVGAKVFYIMPVGQGGKPTPGWIYPVFDTYGIKSPEIQFQIVAYMLGRFKQRIYELQNRHSNFFVVDTQGTTLPSAIRDKYTHNGPFDTKSFLASSADVTTVSQKFDSCYKNKKGELAREGEEDCNWRNEIHPNSFGFLLISKKIYNKILELEKLKLVDATPPRT